MPTQKTVELICQDGNAFVPDERVDLIFTQVYGEDIILRHLAIGTPMVLMGRPGKQLSHLPGVKSIGELAWKQKHVLYASMVPEINIQLDRYECVEPCFWPLSFCVDVLEQASSPGELILDPYMGRGTVGRAARQLGRRFIGIDKNPKRVKMAEEYIWKS